MRKLISIACIAAAAACAGVGGGCHDNTPPPPRVPVPAQDSTEGADSISIREREDASSINPAPVPGATDDRVARGNPRQYDDRDHAKPLPPQGQPDDAMRPPFEDEPILSQRPPEERAFVESYRRVGSPRIALLVNQPPQGAVAANDEQLFSSTDQLRSLDYQAIETIMTDWLASGGQVTVLSPTSARQGHPLDVEILVNVQAQATQQTRDGKGVRVIAEAVNTKGGQSIGRALVDIPPPLEKTTINRYTRFLARKLMDDMTQTWMSPPPPDHDRGAGGSSQEQGGERIPERSVVTPPPAPARQPELPPATQPSDPR